MLHFVGQRTEAVRHLGPERIDVALILKLGEPPVEAEAHRKVGYVILRNEHSRPDRDLRRPAVSHRLSDAGLEARHRLLKHLLVELETDLLDMAGLLLAEQIAGAANIEIMGGEMEARPQRVERLQHLEPAFRLRRELAADRQRKERVGARL